MKTLLLVSLSLCGILIVQSSGMEFENPDLDFYTFKSFDGPLYDSDFYEPYETYGNSYSNDDSNESSDIDGENSAENDDTKKAMVNEGDATRVVEKNEDSSSSEDDNDEDDEESAEQKQSAVKKLEYVDPDQKKFKESGDYVSPEDVAYRLSRPKRSKKPNSREADEEDEEFDSYTKTYNDFVRAHFGKHDENDETDTDDSDSSDEAVAAQAAKINTSNDNQSTEENDDNDDNSNEESDDVDDPDYQRVKKLSAGEGEESKKNSKYCKVVFKDDQECTVCKNPKTHDTSESCSYSSSPAPKRYAFKRQKNYNSNNDDDNDDEKVNHKKDNAQSTYSDSDEDDEPKKRKPNSSSKKSKKRKTKQSKQHNPVEEKLRSYENPHYYGSFYNNDRHTKSPLRSHTLSEYDDDLSFRASEPHVASTSSDGNVDTVLESFKNRDWSKCKHKREKGITCYYCKDADGTTQEECMYSSDLDDENLESNNNKKQLDSMSGFNLEHKPVTTTTQPPIFVKDDSIYRNPVSIMDTFNNNQQQRKLNRDQNFKIDPTSKYQNNQNYDTYLLNSKQQNRRSFDVGAPITTLEYIEPQNKRTLKRMVTYKVHEDSEQKDPLINKSLFYSKIIHGVTI